MFGSLLALERSGAYRFLGVGSKENGDELLCITIKQKSSQPYAQSAWQ